jgi:hypothetical protein
MMKLDLEKSKVDKETGKEVNHPQLFEDSYLDNPPNYYYFKLARENRMNEVDLS